MEKNFFILTFFKGNNLHIWKNNATFVVDKGKLRRTVVLHRFDEAFNPIL